VIRNQAEPAWRTYLGALVRLDRTQISYATGIRNAVGVALPLAWGMAAGYPLAGLTVSIGALNVAFSDQPVPYRVKGATMLLATLTAAVSVLVGVYGGAFGWPVLLLVAAWGFAAGLLVALGPAATQIGLTNVVLLIVMGGLGIDPRQAPVQAALICAGGLFQTLLALAPWPLRRLRLERARLAAVFRRLAEYAAAPTGVSVAPPLGDPFAQARDVLYGNGRSGSRTLETLRALFDQAERIRVELLALGLLRERVMQLRDERLSAPAAAGVARLLRAAQTTLTVLADRLERERLPVRNVGSSRAAERALDPLRAALEAQPALEPAAATAVRELIARGDALAGQLRAVARIASSEEYVAQAAFAGESAPDDVLSRLRASLATLGANLTFRSTSFRHAVRMALTLGAAAGAAYALHLQHGYWVAMTAAIVLKPDFAGTLARGIAREVGTLLGLALATAFAVVISGSVAGHVVLIALLTAFIRTIGPGNYMLTVTAITALVVFLLALAGEGAGATMAERGVNTLLGGSLALVAYAAWPTREREQTPMVLAQMLDAYRRYFAAVMTRYVDPAKADAATLEACRRAARLARSNAEASLDRLRAEPFRRRDESDVFVALLVNSHRFVYAGLALEAHAESAAPMPDLAALRTFVEHVGAAMVWLASALRAGTPPEQALPNLRGDQRALARAAAVHPELHTAAFVADQADTIANSVNTMAHLLRETPSLVAKPRS